LRPPLGQFFSCLDAIEQAHEFLAFYTIRPIDKRLVKIQFTLCRMSSLANQLVV
jgi:hypothetical protein